MCNPTLGEFLPFTYAATETLDREGLKKIIAAAFADYGVPLGRVMAAIDTLGDVPLRPGDRLALVMGDPMIGEVPASRRPVHAHVIVPI